MRKVIVNEFLSPDGVAQASRGTKEDEDGGLKAPRLVDGKTTSLGVIVATYVPAE